MWTRRRFLEGTAVALAGSVLPGSIATADGITLGFSLYGMKSLSLDAALTACAETGYRHVELSLLEAYPTEPKHLSAADRKDVSIRLKELKLGVSGLMLNLSLAADDRLHAQNLEALQAAAQLARDLVPEAPPLIETVLGGKPAEWEQLKDRMAGRLRDWAGAAVSGKVLLAIKAHVGNAVNSPERLLWLLEQAGSPAIRAAYDYSHFELSGLSLAGSLEPLMPHVSFIHVKDSVGDAAKFQFLLPGEGRTDYVAYFKLLKKLGYRGPVVVEVSGQIFNKPGYDPKAAAKQCQASLAAALEKAGG